MKVLVLVLGARVRPYPRLMRVIKRTWASVEARDVETLFYYGGPSLRSHGREIVLPVSDDLPSAGRKTIACFEYLLENRRFDLVFRTNCSSYVDLPNLRQFLDTRAPDSRFYAGVVGTHEGVRFASGSGYVLSRDLVELVVEHKGWWDHSLLDDVALGALLARSGVLPDPTPRTEYRSPTEVVDVDTSQFHFRCRTDTWRRLGDARVILELHRAFCDARGLAPPKERGFRALACVDRLAARARAWS